ncbi:MAG: response regulator transcription factor, partial [Hyphomonadaceae bacterium]|nr:response regulator transcription factor [Hyphomonadaceae bacterium]
GAHRAAVDHLRDALDYADGVETGRKAELRERLGYELQLTGEINAAIEEFGLALLLRQELEDGLKVGDDLRWLSRLHYNAGARLRGEELGRRAIDVLAPIGQTFELAMAYANLALIRALRDDSWGAIELANNTKAIAEELGHTELLADAHSTLAIANQWLDLPSSRNHFESALKLASACHRPELVARIHMNAGGVEMNARSNKAARRWLELGVQYCDERDLSTWAIYMKGLLSDLLVREGKCIEGEALGHEALEMATTTVQRFPCSAALARLLIRRGDTAGALLENLQFDAEPQRVMVYAPILGERAWLLNLEIDTSISVLNQAGAVARQIGNVWAAGEIEYWQAKLEHRQPIASEHVAAPFAHLFNGDWANAARIWSDLEAPYERALALLEGDEPACDEALRVLDRLGASAAGARARRDLRVKGRRGLPRGPRQATRSNVAGLTRREMDVLLLLEEGISNAEIAQRLSTAQKTVDHHVSAILSKLGSSTRLEAVAKARRLNLFGDQSSS